MTISNIKKKNECLKFKVTNNNNRNLNEEFGENSPYLRKNSSNLILSRTK